MSSTISEEKTHSTCTKMLLPVSDALYVLSGKWKIPIIIALSFGNKRFGQIAKEIPKITDRMLAKELRELELNQLVSRKVYDTIPVTVEYSLTEYGATLDPMIRELAIWGSNHRKRMFGEEDMAGNK
jgi:DNA-binding HxlR family transcriptional regulator